MGTPGSPRFFDLSTVTRRIDELLRPAYARTFWVKAEISSGRERGGSFFAELIESRNGRVVARLRCLIWADQLERMRRKFAAAGLELSLADGTVVGMQCRLQFHPQHGLSLSGLDLDPSVALGELELRRRRILMALDRDGLLERNAQRPVALVPLRIGVVTSHGSAAYSDFVRTLLASRYAFRVWVADAIVQGPDAEARVAAALDRLEAMALDLVAIVRGGGSKTDLAWLDSEKLARRIAGYRLPVWTGIGHEIDRGVLDAVAAQSWKTPTAIAEELVGRAENLERRLAEAERRLRGTWSLRVEAQQHLLGHARTGLRQGTRKLLEVRRESLRSLAQGLRARVIGRLAEQRGQLVASRRRLRAAGQLRVRDAVAGLSRSVTQVRRSAGRALSERRAHFDRVRARLRMDPVLGRLERERRALWRGGQVLRAADPGTALARGYSMTTTTDGQLVRSIRDLHTGQDLLTRLADGQFESSVSKTSADEEEPDV